MLTLKTKETFQSERFPGVSFTLRVLNGIQRAKRDSKVAEPLALYREKVRRRDRLYRDSILGAKVADTTLRPDTPEYQAALTLARSEAYQSSPLYDEINRLTDETDRIYKADIMPNAIRACFISIEGLQADSGEALTIDTLLESANEDLIEEIAAKAEGLSGLSREEQKNSESPTTSVA